MGKKITVLGAGAWGTAIASLIARNTNQPVILWCLEEDVVADIMQNRQNKKYLYKSSKSEPFILPDNIVPTTDICVAVEQADIIFEVVPVLFLRNTLTQLKGVTSNQVWVALSKGIEDKTFLYPVDIIRDVLGKDTKVAVLSGPNFAYQVAGEELTATVVASEDKAIIDEVKAVCENDYFKIFASDDVQSVQVAGALKNPMSLFLGLLEGYGYLENTRAYFLTMCLEEMKLLAGSNSTKMCGTMHGLAGLGDLILGLIGARNRNYAIGELFGQGKTLAEVSEMMDVLPEGVNTIKSVYTYAQKKGIMFPICNALYKIIFEGMVIKSEIHNLWCRE